MEILRKYILTTLVAGSIFSCSESPVETNENLFVGEWVIEEVYVDLDIPPAVIEPITFDEIVLPEEVVITQVRYSRQDGIDINGIDFTTGLSLADSYSMEFAADGLYTLENKEELFDLNVLESIFQVATPVFLNDSYFPDEIVATDLGNGNYIDSLRSFNFQLRYLYFSSDIDNPTTTLGIWETVNLGKQILFDYTAPSYEEGRNLWDFEAIDDNTIVLTQSGETETILELYLIEYIESEIDGIYEADTLETYYEGDAFINNARIKLSRK